MPLMVVKDTPADPSREMIKRVCWAGVVSGALIALSVVMQAVTGALSAAATRQAYPETEEARQAAVNAYASLSSFHSIIGYATILPLIVLVATSIFFMRHSGVEIKNTKRPWTQVARAAAVVVVLLFTAYWGKSFDSQFRDQHFWLTPPPGGWPAAVEVAKGQVVTAAQFSTFLVLHGILLPLTALLVLVTMWPAFSEFAIVEKAGKASKWASIAQDNPPSEG
jgi:hypothetical protein